MVVAIAAGSIDPASAAPAGPPEGLEVTVNNDETNPIPVKVQERAVIPFQLSDNRTIASDTTGFGQAFFDVRR